MGRKPSPDKSPADLKLIRIFLPPILEAQYRDYYEQTGYDVSDSLRIAAETFMADLKARGVYEPSPGFSEKEIMDRRREVLFKENQRALDNKETPIEIPE